MKNILIISLCIALLALAACSKNDSNNSIGGSWTFRGATYQVSFANWIRNRFIGYTNQSFPTGSVSFAFLKGPDNTYPRAGTYIATGEAVTDTLHVAVLFTDTAAKSFYIPTPSANTQVTVTRDGDKIRISFPPIQMYRSSDAADSGAIEGTLIQTP